MHELFYSEPKELLSLSQFQDTTMEPSDPAQSYWTSASGSSPRLSITSTLRSVNLQMSFPQQAPERF